MTDNDGKSVRFMIVLIVEQNFPSKERSTHTHTTTYSYTKQVQTLPVNVGSSAFRRDLGINESNYIIKLAPRFS